MAISEQDLRRKVVDFHSGKKRDVGIVEAQFPHEESLTHFLRDAAVLLRPVAGAMAEESKSGQAVTSFKCAESREMLAISLRDLIGNEHFLGMIGDWRKTFNRILFCGKGLEEFEPSGISEDLSKIGSEGNRWLDGLQPSLDLAPEK